MKVRDWAGIELLNPGSEVRHEFSVRHVKLTDCATRSSLFVLTVIMTPSHFWFPTKTIEGMYQFHLEFTEGLSIIKYSSRWNLEDIRNFFTEL